MQEKSRRKFVITLPEQGKKIRAFENQNLLELFLKEGIFLVSDCGGIGKCGKCRIDIVKKGIKSTFFACNTFIDSDLTVLNIAIPKYSDLKKNLKKLSDSYAIAIDLGSTTISGLLIDLETKKGILSRTVSNPLIPYGADILARAAKAAESIKIRKYFKSLLLKAVDNLAGILASSVKNRISSIAVAGNTVMEHLFLGCSLRKVVKYPFIPKFKHIKVVDADEFDLKLGEKCKNLFIFPVISSFVGGDAVAAAFSADDNKNFLLVDIGTNAEVILKDGDMLYAASSPAGPAFEGGEIACGVRNMEGAVDSVIYTDGKLDISTISGKKPAGINGGGLFSIISLFLEHSVIGEEGLFSDAKDMLYTFALRMFEINGEKAFSLYRDAVSNIYITQGDIRKFQLAKGALKAVIELVMEGHRIDKVFVTGNFGLSIKGEIFKKTGIFPENINCRIDFLKDAVLNGCKKFLIDENGIKKLERFRKKIKIIETGGSEKFEKLFIKSLNF